MDQHTSSHAASLRPRVFPTGLRLWQLPGSIFQIMWPGPGSRLIFGARLDRQDGICHSIDHPSACGTYNTVREAQAAVDRFIAVCEAQ